MSINNSQFNIINRIRSEQQNQGKTVQNASGGGFGSILQEKVDEGSGVKFSKHAENRLKDRNINLSQGQKERINQAMKRAEEKGVKDSLILMENMAFVVNVRSKTVITAASSSDLKNNVFTNIDGAVIA